MRAMITLALAVIAGTVSAQSQPEKVAVPFETTAPETEAAPGKIPAPSVSVPRSGSASSTSTDAAAAAPETGSSSRKPVFETVTVPRQSAAPAKAAVETVTVPAVTEAEAPAAVETVVVSAPVAEVVPAPVETPVAAEAAVVVQAEATPVQVSAAPVATSGFGSSTRSWTDLQTSGAAASAEPRPLPGEAGTAAYERYLKSFAYPIPEKFEQDSFSTEGGGN